MFLTMRVGSFVRWVLTVALVVAVVFVVLANKPQEPAPQVSDQPAPTEKAVGHEAPAFLRDRGLLAQA